jgi:enoyl-CoA hydratase
LSTTAAPSGWSPEPADKLNALNRNTIEELHQAFEQAAGSTSVRVVVLTGAGPKAFVAGADISEMNDLSPVQARDFSRHGQKLMVRIEQLGKPVIAMINGFALGGGLELAMACHLRVAADTAKLGSRGQPGPGSLRRLAPASLRRPRRGAELCLTGQPVDAAPSPSTSCRVVPAAELEAETKLAEQLAVAAAGARGILDAIVIAGEASLETGLNTKPGLRRRLLDRRHEGTGAFLARRSAIHGR